MTTRFKKLGLLTFLLIAGLLINFPVVQVVAQETETATIYTLTESSETLLFSDYSDEEEKKSSKATKGDKKENCKEKKSCSDKEKECKTDKSCKSKCEAGKCKDEKCCDGKGDGSE